MLGRHAREERLFSLEEAVRRMTGLTAETFGIPDRGVIRPGAFADLVLFDPATVIDEATFEEPTRPAAGIEQVWVNGETVYRYGDGPTGARPGRLLKNPKARP
ncbi:MAG: amidohydrolase family protein [Acetobacteraceae bacterium]|nr:amidohydrolase family protein [Acetobacteraceae bacterium]